MTHETLTSAEPFEHVPGIYFGLDEDEYHADPALGSTDIKTLAFSPCDYWHGSSHNPNREPQESTPAQVFGSAVHKLVLEGPEAFEAAYAPLRLNGSTKAGKVEREEIDAAGKVGIKADEHARILTAGAAVQANDELAEAFSNGMPEVSVFWEAGGIRRKCRIDYFKARASVDLKSIRNTRNVPFPQACRRAISDWRYDVQAEHYREGRQAAQGHIRGGAVYGDCDPAMLRRFGQSGAAAFVFVFYQAVGAPLTWGTVLSPESPVLEIGRQTIRVAEDNYRSHIARFGLDKPWLLAEPLTELEIDHLPLWFGRT